MTLNLDNFHHFKFLQTLSKMSPILIRLVWEEVRRLQNSCIKLAQHFQVVSWDFLLPLLRTDHSCRPLQLGILNWSPPPPPLFPFVSQSVCVIYCNHSLNEICFVFLWPRCTSIRNFSFFVSHLRCLTFACTVHYRVTTSFQSSWIKTSSAREVDASSNIGVFLSSVGKCRTAKVK